MLGRGCIHVSRTYIHIHASRRRLPHTSGLKTNQTNTTNLSSSYPSSILSPSGVICTTDASVYGNIVTAVGPVDRADTRIFPVGRLDKESTGLVSGWTNGWMDSGVDVYGWSLILGLWGCIWGAHQNDAHQNRCSSPTTGACPTLCCARRSITARCTRSVYVWCLVVGCLSHPIGTRQPRPSQPTQY